MNIYKLASDYLQLQDNCDGDDIAIIKDTMESIKDAMETKAIETTKVIKNLQAELTAVDDEKKRLENRANRLKKNIKCLETSIFDAMIGADIKSINHPIFKISIKKNPPSVNVVNQAELPDKYLKKETTPDKKMIKSDLDQGIKVPGAEIINKKSLRIK